MKCRTKSSRYIFFFGIVIFCDYICSVFFWVILKYRNLILYWFKWIDFTQKSPAQCQQIPCPLTRPPNKRTMLCGSIYLDVEGTLSIYLEGCWHRDRQRWRRRPWNIFCGQLTAPTKIACRMGWTWIFDHYCQELCTRHLKLRSAISSWLFRKIVQQALLFQFLRKFY